MHVKMNPLKRKETLTGWGFALPLVVFLCIFSVVPFVYGFILSLFDATPTSSVFVGFKNFSDLFHDEIFLKSWKTMLIFLIPKLAINVIVPFIFAEIILALKSKKAQAIYRILILLPIVAPGVVGMLIWKNIYSYDGLLNGIIQLFNPNAEPIEFIANYDKEYITILALILMGFPWIGGTSVLIYLSGLMNISSSLNEASKLDGCSSLRRIFSIDIPLCLGQFRYFLIFGIINGVQDYGVQMIFYNYTSTPDFIYVPGFYLYYKYMVDGDIGYASSIGVCIFIIAAFFTALTNYLTRKDVNAWRTNLLTDI